MINRRNIVLGIATISIAGFGGATYFVSKSPKPLNTGILPKDSPLVRPYSPYFGPTDAPVTIVEFFDPSCEACRAFHPIVKQIREEFPESVRVVLRYTTFHKGSDEAVRILETARIQNIFEPVLEAMLDAQPKWATHGNPNLNIAWEAARSAGLDIEKAQRDMLMPDITAILNQDMADVKNVGVQQTPTFFVNGRPLPSFGAEQLYRLVLEEVQNTRNLKP